jgi:hypothetical protein
VTYSASASDFKDGTLPANCSPASGSSFPTGTTTVNCSATNSSSQTTTGSFHVTITYVDNTPPTIQSPGDQTLPATSAAGAVVNYTVTATDPDDPASAITITCDHPSGSTFPKGTTLVTCNAHDAAGNNATPVTFHVTVTDTTAPTIQSPGDQTASATNPAGAVVNYTVTATDPDDNAGSITISCDHPTGSTFARGTTLVTCNAHDAAGNNATPVTFHVTVTDNTAPVITVPASQTVTGTSSAGAVVTFAAPTANDPDDGPVPVNCTSTPAGGLSSGSTFPFGTTTITCGASDTSGNAAAPQSFTITVNDTPPTISGANNITDTTTDPTGKVETFSVTATDIKDGSVPVTCDQTSGSKFPVGTTTVHCSATNSSAQTSTAQFTITITVQSNDTTPPVLSVPANIKVNATSPAGAVVSYTVTATDPDNTPAQITIVCAPASGSTFPLGAGGTTKTTTVSCTAHDPAGNGSSKSFTITVFGVHDQIVALEREVNAATNLSHSQKQQFLARLFLADLLYGIGDPNDAGPVLGIGDPNAAGAVLGNFIKKVGQLTPPLTISQHNQWIAEAQQIKGVMGTAQPQHRRSHR